MHGTKVKCAGTPSLKRANGAINMHSRGPTKQHFYVWEPHCGYPLIKEGQWSYNTGKWSRTPNYNTTGTYRKKLKTLTINESESFCLIYFRHCRKKLCQLGVYSNTKSFHQKRVFEILCKK